MANVKVKVLMARVNNVIAAVKAAIIAKGIDVPEGTDAEEYAGLIASIEGGGEDIETAYNEGYEQGKADEYKRLFNAMVNNSEPVGDIVIEAETIKGSCFSSNKNITGVEMTKVKEIGNMAFYLCTNLIDAIISATCETVGTNAFAYNSNLASVTFKGTPTSIGSNCFTGCNKLLDIYVPWSEGEVTDAPWGATNATVHYNTEV